MRILLQTLIAGCALSALATRALAAEEPDSLRLRSYEAQQADIKTLNDTGSFPVRNYALAKAQCWLDVSFHEYTRNDRSHFPAEAWAQSHQITEELKSAGQSTAALSTPLINGAPRLRPDLWQRLDGLKSAPGESCAASLVACAEVELVHAGNEYRQIGWRHAKPYVQIAEDRTAEAASAASHCETSASAAAAPVEVAPAVASTASVVAVATTAPATQSEQVSIAAAALFKFDRRQGQDLLPRGRAQLNALAARLARNYSSVQSISLVGHTDRLGSAAYNEKLALDRANTVRDYLRLKGVETTFDTSGVGSAQPLTRCPQQRSGRLRRCLQPDRRVDIVIVGVVRPSATSVPPR